MKKQNTKLKNYLSKLSKDSCGRVQYIGLTYTSILDAQNEIIQSREINFDKILKSVPDQKANIIKSNFTKYFKEGEKSFIQRITDDIISLLQASSFIESVEQQTKNSSEDSFIDVDIHKSEELLYPRSSFTFASFLHNSFIDAKMPYKYTYRVPNVTTSTSASQETTPEDGVTSSTVNIARCELNGVGQSIMFPTKYKMICKHKFVDPTGVQKSCGREVYISDLEKHSAIRCTHNLETVPEGTQSHSMKNITSAEQCEWKILHSYTINIYDSTNQIVKENIMAYSTKPIDRSRFSANIIFLKQKQGEAALILATEPKDTESTLKEPALKVDEESWYWINDVFRSIQRYYKSQHGVSISSQNKYVGLVMILLTLARKYFNIRLHAFIMGTSGTGKSFFAQKFIPLLTTRQKVMKGTSVTRTSFIGGRSAFTGLNNNYLFQPGHITSCDVITFEESTNALDEFQNEKLTKQNNLFSMIKDVDYRIDVGIQGSHEIDPYSNLILIGNTEQLTLYNKYRKLVQRYYKKWSSVYQQTERYKPRWPLFAPLEYYKLEIQNEALMKAHYEARNAILGEGASNFITQLPPAEQARFGFFCVLEEYKDSEQEFTMETKESALEHLHNNEFAEALDEKFDPKFWTDEEQKVYSKDNIQQLSKELFEWLTKVYLKGRNNFKRYGFTRYNTHTVNRIFDICKVLVIGQKLYYRKPLEFTNDDRTLCEYFLRFNYNTLSENEANMSKKPYYNDDNCVDEESFTEEQLEANEGYKAKLLQKAESNPMKSIDILEEGEDVEQ